MNILFWIRRQKKNTRGLSPIYCRVTADGIRVVEFSKGIRVKDSAWSAAKQKTKAPIDTARLHEIESRIRMARFHSGSQGILINQEIISRFLSGNTSPLDDRAFLDVVQEYIERKTKQCTAGEITRISLDTYKRRFQNIVLWIQSRKEKQILLSSFSEEDLDDFSIWMKTSKLQHGNPGSHNYIQKHIQLIKAVFKYARAKGFIQTNPVELYKLSFKRGKIVSLVESEINLIIGHKFASQRLQHVADLFLFQCYTGLAFVDLMALGKEIIESGEWISVFRKKTGQECIIPFLPSAQLIWNKYNGELPKISNVKFNAYLKEVGEIVGIDKKITTHVGRKTFGQLMSDRGISMDVISKMLGHANIKTTQAAYVGISTKRILKELLQTG